MYIYISKKKKNNLKLKIMKNSKTSDKNQIIAATLAVLFFFAVIALTVIYENFAFMGGYAIICMLIVTAFGRSN